MVSFSPTEPYNDLPLLPPPVDLESRNILKACIESRTALAALQQSGALIPNQAVLINTIPILEAQASSAIENIVTTADRLFQAAQAGDSQADPATKEALRYSTALHCGFKAILSRPLSTKTAVDVCSRIKGVEMDIRRVPGTALINAATKEVVYTPPDGETLLREKLANWEQFIHGFQDIDPLVRMAVMHYQFEAIHPFTDGNGRTGRTLNLLFLIEAGLLDIPVLYLSRYIIRNKAEYYQLLQDVTVNGAWEPWIRFMLDAIRETSQWTTQKIKDIRLLMDFTASYVREVADGVYSRELIELIFIQPYCRITNVVEANIAKRQTASIYLKKLVSIGVLQEWKSGKEKLFIHPRFLKLLTNEDYQVEPYTQAPQTGFYL
ncbi:Fic family protein [Leptolyngbya boryana CZ1]|uniref:Fic family protein n=1 Tax=Leptolyngbya boryana CZ1 TaxID=3060204 RepID=A0AA97APY9_LEPBY|nr:Fic family protein [Leptolyngbya boryana]WNZ45219.1 Fic family protein [Leptolyngbya boryana CZ1]